MAPDDIGYLPLYKPDIKGTVCAFYVFKNHVLNYDTV